MADEPTTTEDQPAPEPAKPPDKPDEGGGEEAGMVDSHGQPMEQIEGTSQFVAPQPEAEPAE